jgi:phosphate transport system permease protein
MTGSEQSGGGTPLPPPRVGGEYVEPPPESDAPQDAAFEAAAPEQPAPVTGSAQPLAIGVDAGPPVSGAGMPSGGGRKRLGDRVFGGLATGASGFVILIVALVGLFLLVKSIPSITADKDNFLTSTNFDVTSADQLHFGIAALLYVTVIISLVAMVLAVPIAIGIALFITHYAPARLARPIAYVIDLLAAIPSIIYGVWGYVVLSPHLKGVQDALSHIPIPLFKNIHPTGTIFDGAVVLSVMVLPIITAISRDVFERTPRANIEAALALGATKWEMIRMAVLPYGRAGVISGSMLGLGRALGETIAVLIIVSTVSPPFHPSLFTGGSTIAAQIANNAAEFNNAKTTGAYIAAGLVLFLLTFVVNAAARAIVNRKKDFV